MTTVIMSRQKDVLTVMADGMSSLGETDIIKAMDTGDQLIGFSGNGNLIEVAKYFFLNVYEFNHAFEISRFDLLECRDMLWGYLNNQIHVTGEEAMEVMIGMKYQIASFHLTGYCVPRPWSGKPFDALGSGAGPALGVLAYGGTIEEAMAVALELDHNSGGEIQKLSIAY